MGPRACIACAMCKLPRPPPQAIREQVTQLLKGVPLMRVSGGGLESKEKVRCALRSPGGRRLRARPGSGAGRDAAPRGWARALRFSRGQVQVPWGSEALPETLPCLSTQTPRELRQPPQSLGCPRFCHFPGGSRLPSEVLGDTCPLTVLRLPQAQLPTTSGPRIVEHIGDASDACGLGGGVARSFRPRSLDHQPVAGSSRLLAV